MFVFIPIRKESHKNGNSSHSKFLRQETRALGGSKHFTSRCSQHRHRTEPFVFMDLKRCSKQSSPHQRPDAFSCALISSEKETVAHAEAMKTPPDFSAGVCCAAELFLLSPLSIKRR